MKLFGGGKKGEDKASPNPQDEADYYDSPVETVSLSGAPAPAKAAAPAPAPPPHQHEEERPHYGIDQAIQLMRALPVADNVELVVQVIKTTLESLRVRVADIIEDAIRKEQNLEGRVTNLTREITEFEREIQTRRDEIGRLEADHAETSSVKARLQLAEKAQQAQRATAPAAHPPVVASTPAPAAAAAKPTAAAPAKPTPTKSGSAQ
jgi:hypothetical protein